VSAAVARVATGADHDWLAGYAEHCHTLGISDRALRGRLHAARAFLARHRDPAAWMTTPVEARLTDLRQEKAWPLVAFLIGTGRLRLDMDLMASKNLTGLAAVVRSGQPQAFEVVTEAGLRLGWTQEWVRTVAEECLAVIVAWSGVAVRDLTAGDLDRFATALDHSGLPASSVRAYRNRLASARALLFEARIIDTPPRRRPWARTLAQRFEEVSMNDAIRDTFLRYVQIRATVLRPNSIESLANDLLVFAEFLTAHDPDLVSLRDLRRDHIEAFLLHNATRTWRGRKARDRVVSASVRQAAVLSVRNMLEDITLWGWSQAPGRALVFATDIPKLDQPLPRALAPDVDRALMTAIAGLPDPFGRVGLHVLRHAGLRIGELLDLPLDAVVDHGPAGTWLRVPIGKMGTERSVPLDAATVAALDTWVAHRGPSRPLPHPRTGALTDFMFTEHGRRLGPTRLRHHLADAVVAAGLLDAHGQPLPITPHQLRHTYATELANAGMSMQALMALLGHVTPQMTIRYATLASPTLRTAYEHAIGGLRGQLDLAAVGRPVVPDHVTWLNAEMIKTRLANGFCTRHLAQGACAYANICETCDNFTPGTTMADIITAQLHDEQALADDAKQRGWASEHARHAHVATSLDKHLEAINRARA